MMNERDLMTGDHSELPKGKCGEVKFIGLVEKEPERIKIFAEYCSGLAGLEKYSHVIVLYWFHQRDTPGELLVGGFAI